MSRRSTRKPADRAAPVSSNRKTQTNEDNLGEFSITETIGSGPNNTHNNTGNNTRKKRYEKTPRTISDKGYFAKIKVHSDALIRKDLYIGHRIFTQPYNEKITIGKDCPHLQVALNSFVGQHGQAKLLVMPAGTYRGCFRLDRAATTVSIEGATLGLRISGDDRYIAGMAYVHGVPLSYNSIVREDPGAGRPEIFPPIGAENGIVDITMVDGTTIKIKVISSTPTPTPQGASTLTPTPQGDVSSPDLTALNIVSGDKIILRDERGELTERDVKCVDGNLLTFSGVPVGKVTAIVFCPNVTLIPDENLNEPLFLVANAGITFRGVRFSGGIVGPKANPRSALLSLIGHSTANTVGCLFDDLSRRTRIGIAVSTGSLIFAGEVDDIGRQAANSTIYPLTVIGCEKTGIRLTSGSSLVESCTTVIGCGGSGCLLKAGSICTPHKLVLVGNGAGVKAYSGSLLGPTREASFHWNGISIVAEVGSTVTMPESSFAPGNIKTHTTDGQVNATFKTQLLNAPVITLTMDPRMNFGGISIYYGKHYEIYSMVPGKHVITLVNGNFIGAGIGEQCSFDGNRVGEGLSFLVLDSGNVLVTTREGLSFS